VLSDSVAEMTLGTMIPNNDCPSLVAGCAGGDEAWQHNVRCRAADEVEQKRKVLRTKIHFDSSWMKLCLKYKV
jgi:hypothetical protein